MNRALIAAVATWTALALFDRCVVAEPGELLLVRWLHTACEHPWRMSLVASIAAYGLFGNARACQPRRFDEGARKNP